MAPVPIEFSTDMGGLIDWPSSHSVSASEQDEYDKSIAKGGVTVPFPWKLHNMLDAMDREGDHSIVQWQPHGRAFVVHDPKLFVSIIMPKYFNQSKVSYKYSLISSSSGFSNLSLIRCSLRSTLRFSDSSICTASIDSATDKIREVTFIGGLFVGSGICAEIWCDKRSRAPRFEDLSRQRRSPTFTFQTGRKDSGTQRNALRPDLVRQRIQNENGKRNVDQAWSSRPSRTKRRVNLHKKVLSRARPIRSSP